jgi:hypothetical protein
MGNGARDGDPSPERRALQLDLRETSQLWWWFQNGSIMTPSTRGRLRRAWGLCPRHSWAHAVVECELRSQPYSTAGLYLDLTGRAAEALTERPRRRAGPPVDSLHARDICVLCEWLDRSTATPDLSFETRRRRFNRMERTRTRLAASWPVWMPASCPHCGDGQGLLCRPHLLARDPERVDATGCAAALNELRDRLERLVASMTLHGPPATPQVAAAWIEAVGWFAGWGIAHQLAGRGS